jgi:hypothetical protein
MDRLNTLQSEYEDVKRNLAFPLDIEDLQAQTARCNLILEEARRLAQSLNISGITGSTPLTTDCS